MNVSRFGSHPLNAEGATKCGRVAHVFDALLAEIERETGIAPDSRGEGAREMALVRTHLETACFYANAAIARQTRHQEPAK